MNKRKKIRIVLLTLLVLSIGTLGHSATINVTTTQDNVAGSLREAITTANSNNEDDIIQLPAGTYILSGSYGEDGNSTGDIDIDNLDTITILGEGAGVTIIDGGAKDRVFHILNGTVSISDVTIQNGTSWPYILPGSGSYVGLGGGLYNSGTLSLTNCEITGNRAMDGSGHGGGIYSVGTASLTNCTVSHNNAGDGPDDLESWGGDGGGIYNKGELVLTNCTVYNNEAGFGGEEGGSGGGIYTFGTLNLTNCTISHNITGQQNSFYAWSHDGYGGGIRGDATIKNTIVANNQLGGLSCSFGPDCYGTLNSQGYNLIGDTSDCTITGTLTGNISGVDPLLGPLADNGGPTQTCALLPGSPALDAGDSTGISQDQRGYTRPVDIPGITNASDGSDIGAFELDQYTISGTVTANGTGLPGVTLTFSNSGGATTTDSQGNYSHTVSYGWSGTVTPSKEDYSFTPENREYTNVTADQPNQDYTANPYSVSISITNPQDGATVSGIVTISTTALSEMDSGSASIQAISKVEFYIDNILVNEDTTAPYEYLWDTNTYSNGIHTIKVKATNSVNQAQETEITVTVENIAQISLNRTRLNFGAETSGIKTGPQTLSIANAGNGILNWTMTGDADWLNCSPSSGTQSGTVTVSIDSSSLAPGNYIGIITVEAANAYNSPQTVSVYLTVYSAGSTAPPFGSFDAPINNSTVQSSIPVTGWALDDIEIESMKIFREPLTGEGSQLVYIGEAVLVEGARPDVETAYPDSPMNYKAGWGYMLLTYFLPNQGNGTFTLHAIAADKDGHTITIGTKTITCDNANAEKPFGAMDTPAQGDTISGNDYANFGWALTPLPNTIPFDGSTITVWVDGVALGNPGYNRYREDIATLFPGYNNSDGAVGLFYLDITQYEDGVHTIAWTVEDDAGNSDGIGSRYFTVQNTAGSREQGAGSHGTGSMEQGVWKTDPHSKIPFDVLTPVQIIKGFKTNSAPQTIYPDNDGIITIEINQLERLEIHLDQLNSSSFITHHSSFYPGYSGYQRVGCQLKSLPIGSTFDPKNGIFSWMPGPASMGKYEFVFIQNTGIGEGKKKIINIKINHRE